MHVGKGGAGKGGKGESNLHRFVSILRDFGNLSAFGKL